MTVIAASGLSVERDGGDPLVRDVSFSVSPGEMVLLAGPSGSGKTLLGKAVSGILGPRSTLSVTGEIRRYGTVGYLFQNPRTQLVRRGVRQDIAFGLENAGMAPVTIEERLEAWAERVDATHLLDRGIDDLSRGETAVVALLGTLVTEPDLVVLDEPLAPLDERNRQFVLDVVDELRDREATLLVAEHDSRGLLERADRVLLLENGQITASGAPEALRSDLREAGIRLPFETLVGLEGARTDESASRPDGGDRKQ
jgi:energy-coupling factor transporter ATP-binding protein EcfA2